MTGKKQNRKSLQVLETLPPKRHQLVNGIRLAYREAGEGRPLFLLHGMNGESGSWLHQLNSLSDQYRVIAWDAPGYGGSDSVGETISSLASTAFELLRELRAEKPILVCTPWAAL